jgi:hypothetical protein
MPNAIRYSAANLNLRPKESGISKYRKFFGADLWAFAMGEVVTLPGKNKTLVQPIAAESANR